MTPLEQVLRSLIAGESPETIARALGVDVVDVEQLRDGIWLPSAAKSVRDRSIITDHARGVSLAQLARQHGLSKPRVAAIIHRGRDRSQPRLDRAAILLALLDGTRVEQVARTHHTNTQMVRLIAAGVGLHLSAPLERARVVPTRGYGGTIDRGRYGILDRDDDGRLLCHLCGEPYEHLATHARMAHGMTAARYRDRYGLGTSTPLVGERTTERMRSAWQRHAHTHLTNLDTHRDPATAYHHSVSAKGAGQGTWAPETRAKRQQTGRATRSRDLTIGELASLGDSIDLQTWADAARQLLTDPTLTAAAIARACDISPATVAQRLRRYPPRT